MAGLPSEQPQGNPEGLGVQRTLALAPVSGDTLGVGASRSCVWGHAGCGGFQAEGCSPPVEKRVG